MVPCPTCCSVPGTMCHVLAPTSVNGPPSGNTPVGRFTSNCVSPFGGAPTIAVPPTPMVCRGPSTGPLRVPW